MSAIVYSQESIFHLYRLARVAMGASGKRFKLDEPTELASLIRFCDQSKNTSINLQFDAFLTTVDPDTFEQMTLQGLVRVNRDHWIHDKSLRAKAS